MIGNIRITADTDHPMGWVTNLDGETIKGVTAARLDLSSMSLPRAEIDLVCGSFDIEARLVKANVTIVKNPPNILRDLDLQLTWLKEHFKAHPQDFDCFEAAIATHSWFKNNRERREKFLDIFRHARLKEYDYSVNDD